MDNITMETINTMSEQKKIKDNKKSHMPENSLFYEKIIPALMIMMGIITLALIIFAAGVLLGFVKF